MTALGQLHGYLRRLEWRLRFFAASRGLAVTAGCALLLTLLFVYIGNVYEFASGVVTPLRVTLYAAVAVAISLALLRPLLRLNRRHITRDIERRAPEFKERLLTIAERERAGENGAWMELLAEDTLQIAKRNAPEQIRSSPLLYALAGGFVLAGALLVWMVASGPGYWGYGASLLWTGKADAAKRPLYAIEVKPGNKTVRRRSDQKIVAQLVGFSAPGAILHARYGKASRWDAAPMEPGSGHEFRFTFAAVSEPVEYYVEASHSKSKHFQINVKDLPGVQRIRVALHFPEELGLQNVTLDPAGDIRAVKGTEADVFVKTDKPLERGALVFRNGQQIPLTRANNNWLTARVPVQKDDTYHVAAIDGGEAIRISEDYFVEAQRDEAPTVKISRPGGDLHVSPIEEMPVTVQANDDYGVNNLELHYAVNGGPEKTYSLSKAKGVKESEKKTTIALEDLKTVPGDMLSLYAVARDAHGMARSEIIFAQADGFDYKFSQSQQAGGMSGGGGSNESEDISKRQKQIIAATFNQIKNPKTGTAKTEDAKFLSGEQAKLSEQAQTLAARMGSREMGASDKKFEEFAKLMVEASGSMTTAADQLKPAKWNDALGPEQKALSSLLRAETLFRDIQISMAKAGGGQGRNNAGRDLARMFDLELDTSKNQYETGQQNSPQQAEKEKAFDDARRRLEDLARRQQELAKQQNLNGQQFEQRWQEEQLRREAEELKRQMQEMAKNSENGERQQGQQQSGQQSQGEQQAQNSSPQDSQAGQQTSQSGQMSGRQSASGRQQQGQRAGAQQSQSSQQQSEEMRRAMKEATRALDRAEEAMRQSVSNHDKAAGARAAEQLKQAQQLMAQAFQKQAGGTMSDLANRAEQIASTQREIANKMRQMYGGSPYSNDPNERLRNYARMPGDTGDPNAMPEMNDPNQRFRNRYGRRMMYGQPGHIPTPSERALADEKDRLAGQLESLQRQAQQQAQTIYPSRPDAAQKMQRALSDAEGRELALRMQKNAEWMRQGYGDRNLNTEDAVANGLTQLGRDLRDVEVALNSPDPAGERKSLGKEAAPGTRTTTGEQSPAQYRDAVAGYFKKLSQSKMDQNGR